MLQLNVWLRLFVLVALVGCGDDGSPVHDRDHGPGDAGGPIDAGSSNDDQGGVDAPAPGDLTGHDKSQPLKTVFGGSRPVQLKVPAGYTPSTAYPLVILLHGFGANGMLQAAYFGYLGLVDKEQLLLAYPDGKSNPKLQRYWNATHACCDFYNSGVDDAGYLSGLIKEIQAVYNVDPRRIYFIGHSNGGFMSYRMACDHAQTVAAIVSLAGSTYAKPADCTPANAVSVLQIHGTLDTVVRYDGKPTLTLVKPYPGAEQTVAAWAKENGCSAQRTVVPPALDLDQAVLGAETTVERYAGCPAGIDVELWKMTGSSHIPALPPAFAAKTWGFLKSHPRPK
jgi:polyhydroxybutyrate depolymerase